MCLHIFGRFPLGKGLSNVFSHLLSIMSEHKDLDGNIICGDFNSQIDNLKDFVPGLENIMTENFRFGKTWSFYTFYRI